MGDRIEFCITHVYPLVLLIYLIFYLWLQPSNDSTRSYLVIHTEYPKTGLGGEQAMSFHLGSIPGAGKME